MAILRSLAFIFGLSFGEGPQAASANSEVHRVHNGSLGAPAWRAVNCAASKHL